MTGRRNELQSLDRIPSTAHAGLWIDKLLRHGEKGKGETNADHFRQVVRAVDPLYKQVYERWKKSLADIGAQRRPAHVLGRLSVGLGGEGVHETSIALHHTYGIPYIPGSALKGLAARYTRKRLQNWTPEHLKVLFGDTNAAGYVTFFDAHYIPESAKRDTPLALDVMNVHHPGYYRGEDVPPADWDSPTPISFLSATGSYLIALHGPDEWVNAAFEILAHALKEEGIGAKTSSGYGRMEIEDSGAESISTVSQSLVSQPAQARPAQPVATTVPVVQRRGVIIEIRSDRHGYGRVRDLADQKEYRFALSATQGETPGKKAIVIFELQGDHVVKVRKA